MKAWLKSYGLAILLMGALCGVTFFLVKHRNLSKSDERDVLAMEELKDSIQRTLNDLPALEATLRLNSNRFSCMSAGEDCLKKTGLFLLYGIEKNSPFPLSQISTEKGFTSERANCSDFPSPNCPLRVEASWRPAGDPRNCEGGRPLYFHVRVILHSGNIFLDWKTEKVSAAKIAVGREAMCKCAGKSLVAGECRNPIVKEIVAPSNQSPPDDSDQARLEEERRERELANATASDASALPECPSILNFRNEEFAVVDVSPKGETQIELEGEDTSCQSVDVFRFQCARKLEAGVFKGDWVFAGMEKGTCAAAGTNSTIAGESPQPEAREPGEEALERSPAADGAQPEVLEIKQGILSE